MTRLFRRLAPSLLAGAMMLTVAAPAAAQQEVRQGPPPEVRALLDDVVATLTSDADSTLDAFVKHRMAADYRASFTDQELKDHFGLLRAVAAESDGTVGARGQPGNIVMTLNEAGTVNIRVQWNDDLKVTRIESADDSEAVRRDDGDGGPDASHRVLREG